MIIHLFKVPVDVFGCFLLCYKLLNGNYFVLLKVSSWIRELVSKETAVIRWRGVETVWFINRVDN